LAWIDATGQVEGRRGQGVLRQAGGVMGNGDRVEVDNTKKGVVVLLKLDPIANSSKPVA
jgi:hypothetical protein